MKVPAPENEAARRQMCRELSGLIPEEKRRTHKVVVAWTRFGWCAKVVRHGPLSGEELARRRRLQQAVAVGRLCAGY